MAALRRSALGALGLVGLSGAAWAGCTPAPGPQLARPTPCPTSSAPAPSAATNAAAVAQAPDAPDSSPPPRTAEYPRLALGRAHSCLVVSRERALCWGDNTRGQLGSAPSAAPVTAPIAFPVAGDLLRAGGDRTCVFEEEREANGANPARPLRLRCAGAGFSGLAEPRFATFKAATGQDVSVDDLLVTSSAVCLSGSAAIDGGWLRCDDGAKALRPFEHVGLACCSPGCKPVVCPRVGLTLTARGSDACLLSFDNVPASWIECSRKGWSTTYEPMHMADREAYAIRQIALGAGFVCVLDEVGVTSCWGEAIGSPSAQRPILVGNFRRMRTICATLTEVCGIDEDARVSCASASEVNAHAVLLRGTPVRLACGDRHACAATKEGTVECWGANERGQLGDGTTTPATPTEPRRVKLPPTPAPLPSGTR